MKIIFFILLSFSTLYSQNIIRVPKDYKTIQAAINNSIANDTILISQGTYKENLRINKPIVIIGDPINEVIIKPDSFFVVPMYIYTSNVVIHNLHITKPSGNSGILIENSDSCIINTCVVDSNISYNSFGGGDNDYHGIDLLSCNNILILNSVVKDNRGGTDINFGTAYGGDGIGLFVDSSSNIEVKSCKFLNNQMGASNVSGSGDGIGIKLENSNKNIDIRNCSIYYNNEGILFDYNSDAIVGGAILFSNNIYDNSFYNINNTSLSTINATFNNWGTNNIDSIKAKIFGAVNFSDYITNIISSKSNYPNSLVLFQNYPNPFNPTTEISYQLSAFSHVSLKVYDVLGRELRTLVNENQAGGEHKVEWNAKSFSSGIYFYQIKAGEYISTKKMLLIK